MVDRLSGNFPDIFSIESPMAAWMSPELLTVIYMEPLSRATVKRVSVAVAQFQLDVLMISFNGFGTNPKFLRDPARSEARAVQRENMQFAVGQVRYLRTCRRTVNDLVNNAQCDPGTNIQFTCENRIKGTDQLFSRAGFHPIPRGARAQRAFCVNLLALSRYSENPDPGTTRNELLEKKNPVVMAKEWFNDEEIWLMFFDQLTRRPFIRCESANCIAQLTPDNRNESLSGDSAVVSDKYRRPSPGENSGENPHKHLRVPKPV
jgi:hypothetical protein